jgi:hypothetical protein
MKKKNYTPPTMEVVAVEIMSIMAGSITEDGNKVTIKEEEGEINAGSFQSAGYTNIWEE